MDDSEFFAFVRARGGSRGGSKGFFCKGTGKGKERRWLKGAKGNDRRGDPHLAAKEI